jgi:hypothetical protein
MVPVEIGTVGYSQDLAPRLLRGINRVLGRVSSINEVSMACP